MKSTLKQTISFKDMTLPEELFQIEIPSWDTVIQPLKTFAVKQYQENTGKTETDLTDEIVEALDQVPVNTVVDFERMAVEVYKEQQLTHRYYYEIFPLILREYVKQSDYILDDTELNEFVNDYFEELKVHADKHQLSLSEYGKKIMDINEEDVEEEFKKRAKEDFVFKLIAIDHFKSHGGETDELAYESFIQKNVIHQQADPIELKEKIPYEVFVKLIPEMQLSQEIYDYFFPKIEFVINPDATLSFNE